MSDESHQRALQEIRENISRFGYHLYCVMAGESPRYVYSIGLSEKLGHELVLAGGIFYMYEEVGKIIEGVVEKVTSTAASTHSAFAIDTFGTFSLRSCDASWVTLLMLGASDYYRRTTIPTLQIVPDEEHKTIDVPDMAVSWSPQTEPVWRCLKEPWPYSIPSTSEALADLDALRGFAVTEACRWEEDYWELFAGEGPDVPKDETRIVGLGTLLAADPSLAPILDLKVGGGIWREDDLVWHVWERREGNSESAE